MHIGRITINTISLDAHLFRCVYGQPGCCDTVGNRIFWNGEQLLAQMLINEAKNHFFSNSSCIPGKLCKTNSLFLYLSGVKFQALILCAEFSPLWLSLSTLENCIGCRVILYSENCLCTETTGVPVSQPLNAIPGALPSYHCESLPTFLANLLLWVSALVENICIYFVTGYLYLLISATYFTRHPPPPQQPPVCSLYLWVCFYVVTLVHLFCFFLDATGTWNHMAFVFQIMNTLKNLFFGPHGVFTAL